MKKTTIKWLEGYLNTKVLPCPEGNDYVYGMNVAHENLINYLIPALLEKEKEQIIEAYCDGFVVGSEGNQIMSEEYYNQTYNQDRELSKDVKDLLDNL